jgi:hypothetical protein
LQHRGRQLQHGFRCCSHHFVDRFHDLAHRKVGQVDWPHRRHRSILSFAQLPPISSVAGEKDQPLVETMCEQPLGPGGAGAYA